MKRSKQVIKTNLVDGAKRLLDLLREMQQNQDVLLHANTLKNALYRYEALWLPLLAKFQGRGFLTPPRDVYLLWLCHMLTPEHYHTDCQNIMSKTPKHSVRSKSDRSTGLKKCRDEWRQCYPNDPFELDPKATLIDHVSSLSVPLQESAKSLIDFAYQVALPHYQDPMFLRHALERYLNFLQLLQENKEIRLVPCYDIDLVWHVHLLHPIAYRQDMQNIVGRMIDHNQSSFDRSLGSALDDAFTATKTLWQTTFHQEYESPGAMYRGRNEHYKLKKSLTEKERLKLWQKTSQLSLSNIQTQGINLDRHAVLSVSLIRANDSDEKVITQLRMTRDGQVNGPESTRNVLFNSGKDESIGFEVIDKPGMFSKKRILLHGKYHLLQEVENLQEDGLTKGMSVTLSGEHGGSGFSQIGFSLRLEPPTNGPCVLRLLRGSFHSVQMPPDLNSLWGPVSHISLPKRMSDHCLQARHRLLSTGRQKRLGVLVLHSIPLMMSCVQIFTSDHMLCLGHLIGSDQLPSVAQIQNRTLPSIDRQIGSRAMLVKDHVGDYAIISAHWNGYEQNLDPLMTQPGSLVLTLHDLRNNKTTKHQIKNDRLKIDDVTVDMTSALFHGAALCENLPQKVCAILCAVLLGVLCEPKPSRSADLSNVHKVIDESTGEDADGVSDVMLAVGCKEQLPSNSFLKNFIPESGCSSCWAKPAMPS
ncbi:hypothetical protein CAPTEDRAFT_200727 [Capitella teleta]|uniref:Uncharacterized protein n=1 Tax=Capitella teleta TaxID=283909 RepID=R7USV8_CAPTE|nr:hypothetical protein CAPTEDRAFT_200727 [Capitella teleta]|eukprot:ELU09248.1 hypothetical protein CAPTEDRAFT_200727 [Capitella teleta]